MRFDLYDGIPDVLTCSWSIRTIFGSRVGLEGCRVYLRESRVTKRAESSMYLPVTRYHPGVDIQRDQRVGESSRTVRSFVQ